MTPPGPRAPDGVTPAQAAEAARRLREARPSLVELKTATILEAVEGAVAEWLEPASGRRAAAEEAFRAASGLAPETAPFAALLEPCAGRRVRDWLEAWVRPAGALDGFVADPAGGCRRALGPDLAVLILSGNVPAVWLPSFLACLLMRTPCLIKPAAGDPLTAPLFAATLGERCPPLAGAAAVLSWAGGDEAVEREVFARAGAVIAFGGTPAQASLAGRIGPETALLAHGPRTAAGLLAREAAAPGAIEGVVDGAARDALLYDGRGCLSLAAVYVEEGGALTPRAVAEELARAMDRAAAALPAGRPDPEAAALTQSWRARLRARALSGKDAAVLAGPSGLDWTVLYDRELPPPDAPLVRTLWVSPLADARGVVGRASALGNRLHALAYAGPRERGEALAGALAAHGLTRLAPFGTLQTPDLGWPHGGAAPFPRLLNWTRVEG